MKINNVLSLASRDLHSSGKIIETALYSVASALLLSQANISLMRYSSS